MSTLPRLILACGLLLAAPLATAAAPELPPGLAPGLPPGLAPTPAQPADNATNLPGLPPGLGDTATAPEPPADPAGRNANAAAPAPAATGLRRLGQLMRQYNFNGFVETRLGLRTQADPHQRDASIAEARLQLDWQRSWQPVTARVTADLLYDDLSQNDDLRLERGDGWLDLRQANMLFSPVSFMDIKVGRQILTWGTGDQIFINDLFPKDWVSFFIGRDDEYLKAPSDAIKLSLFSDLANLDLVYTPRFDPDRFITGQRLSYWNSGLGARAGRDQIITTDLPDRWIDAAEYALRLYRNLAGIEYAIYLYDGFWKSPGGSDPLAGTATFPRLRVYGASVRAPLGRGIANAEAGYYDSRDNRDGDDPFRNPSQSRVLVGYEQELARNLTGTVQYYVEILNDYAAYARSRPPTAPDRDQYRQLLTLRLTQLLLRQTLTLSVFIFYSPTDHDLYARPRLTYELSDNWTVEAGANIFAGSHPDSFFGQFDNNTNVYGAIRYGF